MVKTPSLLDDVMTQHGVNVKVGSKGRGPVVATYFNILIEK